MARVTPVVKTLEDAARARRDEAAEVFRVASVVFCGEGDTHTRTLARVHHGVDVGAPPERPGGAVGFAAVMFRRW